MVLVQDGPVSERDLILRAQGGESEAFGELVQRYMRRAYFGALGLVGSPEDALDLSQEAFVRAFRARGRIDAERPFYTWYYQILRRLCFNHVRDKKSRRKKLEHAAVWLAEEAGNRRPAPDPAIAAERQELRRRVWDAIETLPEREREIIILREFEGLRYREIAHLLGIPAGTVMSRLYTARRHLATAMEDRA